jgi:outer membrane immunogenic protein
MKKALFSATAIVLALTAGSTFAADLPGRKEPAYIPPPPPPMWTGFYVGLNAGGAWTENNGATLASGPLGGDPGWLPAWLGTISAVGASTGAQTTNAGTFIGGGQAGYNFQFQPNFLVGLEADIQGVAGGNGSLSSANIAPLGPAPVRGYYSAGETIATSLSTQKQLDYLGTVRGRLGYLALPNLLIYGTGGLAYGGVSSSASVFQANNDCSSPLPGPCLVPAASTGGSYSSTRVGWTAGGGIEWMFLPNWSAKFEYLRYDLGASTYTLPPLVSIGGSVPAVTAAVVATQLSTQFAGNIVRAGVNYHLNWGAPAPVVARY